MNTNNKSQPISASAVSIAVLLLAALALRLLFFNGGVGSDDFNYYRFAQSLWSGHGLGEAHHQAARLTLLVLVAGPGVLAGNIEVSGLVNLLLSMLLVGGVAAFCWRYVGPVAALVATAFIGFDVPSVVYAGVLLPEPLLTIFMFASTACLFLAAKNAEPRRRGLLAFASGALVALAYSTKEPGILLLVPAGAYLLLAPAFGPWPARIRASLGFGAGFLTLALLDALMMYVLTGDALFKQHGVANAHNVDFSDATLYYVAQSSWWKIQELLASPFVFAIPLFLGALGWCLVFYRRSALWPFAAAGAFVLLYLLFGSSSFSRYVGLPLQERYLTPAIAYAAVGFGAAMQWLWDVHARRRMAAVALCSVVAVQLGAAVLLSAERSGRLFFTEGLRNLASAIASLPDDDTPIYGSRRTVTTLQVLLNESLRRRLQVIDAASGLQPGYYAVLLRNDQALWLEPDEASRVRALPLAARARMSNRWALWPRLDLAEPARDWAEVRMAPGFPASAGGP